MNEEIKLIADQIKKKIGGIKPEIALILGSGLGGLADMIENPVITSYSIHYTKLYESTSVRNSLTLSIELSSALSVSIVLALLR